MRCDTPALSVAVAAMLGLAAPPLAAPASATVALTLCGGGVLHLDLGGKRGRRDGPGACHAACAVRRDDDDDREGCGTRA